MVSHRIKLVPKYNFDIKLGWRLKKEALDTNLIYKLKALYYMLSVLHDMFNVNLGSLTSDDIKN